MTTVCAPAVSVILPAFNREAELRAAVASVLRQEFQDWELIIADDGSEAATRAWLGTLADPRIAVLLLAHTGSPAHVRNQAIRAARGEYLAFLDSDDTWRPDKLGRQLAFMRSRGLRWSYTAVTRIDAHGNTASNDGVQPWRVFEGDIVAELLRVDALLATPAVMAERQLVLDAGTFDEQQRWCEDYDLWIRLAMLSKVGALPEPLASVRVHDNNFSQDRIGAYTGWFRLYGKYRQLMQQPELRRLCRRRGAETALALAAAQRSAGRPAESHRWLRTSFALGWNDHCWWRRLFERLARRAGRNSSPSKATAASGVAPRRSS